MSGDAPQPPDQGKPVPDGPEPDEPFAPQDGWFAPAPQSPYAQAPPLLDEPEPPAGRGGRVKLFAGLGIGAVLVAAGVAVAVVLNTDSQHARHRISIPQSAGSLRLLTNADTTARISALKAQLAGNPVYANPQLGFYGLGASSSYSVWLLAEETTGIPSFQNTVRTLGADTAAKQIAAATGMRSVQAESAGPLGGAMLCGTLAEETVTVYACEWLDSGTFGLAYFLPAVSRADAPGYTLDLRGESER